MLRYTFLFVTIIVQCLCLPAQQEEPLKEVIDADNKFTSKLMKELSGSEESSYVFSGLSADIITSLLASGAKGSTKSELLLALNLVKNDQQRNDGVKQLTSHLSVDTDKLKILSANKIYPADGFTVSEDFRKTAVDDYDSEVENVDFKNGAQAAGIINKWVEQKTNGKIQNLIDPNQLRSDTKLVLANTLYFSGQWVEPFRFTGNGLFQSKEGQSKEIPMLQDTLQAKFRHCGFYKTKFLELDIADGKASMMFVLPDERDGLSKMENDFVGVSELHSMKSGYVNISIPKFQIETAIDFVPLFKKLGAEQVFRNDADLSGLSSVTGLQVDSIRQKTIIDVTQDGVEAAAATGVQISPTSAVLPVFTFIADRPFLYYIREKNSEAILFAGRYSG
ncbi:unnamed protein product [Phyllotreta striolata]|uniref:Serpin domain-containing protein n=1 Tax=Phyllotreta striolata TaxID=444603 RepID=A0A9N9XR69_PHYSR|nr:unnamed protein product [Phyllotreta striolata]